jgi:hypothetical protein
MCVGVACSLEGAPVPIPRYTGSNLRSSRKLEGITLSAGGNGSGLDGVGGIRGRGTGSSAAVAAVPVLKLLEAVTAGTGNGSPRVELGVLVERSSKG